MSNSVRMAVGMAAMMSASMHFDQEKEKKRILDEWEKSKKLPRKKKKKRRKELALDWAIANWEF